MADTTALAAPAADAPTGADLERVQKFTREPVLLEGEELTDLHPGSARRRALDAALAEIEEGFEEPSPEWRGNYSLLLGLERILAEERPLLRDGAELSEHQVDALSGTLAAIISEIEEPGSNLAAANGNGGNGAAAEVSEDDDALAEDEEPQDWDEEPIAEDEEARSSPTPPRIPAPPAASGSSTRPAPARPSPPSASSSPPAPAGS